MENEPGSQGRFLLHINQQIPWHEISVFEKIYDVVNMECTFKLEKLRIFIPRHTLVSGYYVFTLAVRSPYVRPSALRFVR